MKNVMKLVFLLLAFANAKGQGIELPPEFEDVTLLTGLQDPSTIAFSPDGRLFYTERITGALRVAKYDSLAGEWQVLADPFFTFDVPSAPHRSSGLRGIAFDPEFDVNGFVYVFYMKDNPRHNRVVRIQADPAYPDTALATEELLIEVPFNNSASSGSHNGGDLVFGTDGKLYFTTGDGWNGGDNVQSLSTFTGKLFRISADGSIPEDNPFYDTASGDYRAIYALGLRNPYTVSCVSETGNIYINDAVGSAKATVHQIMGDGTSAGANFGHDGYNGIGTQTDEWANTGVGNTKLITGGAWYPESGYWPPEYRGNYFAAMWGSNSGDAGHIVRVESETNTSASIFASGVLIPPRHKPVMTEIGPDGDLYYLLTDYETGDGEVHKIRYTGQLVTAAPEYSPPPGQYDDPLNIAMDSETGGAAIYYTTDGTEPDSTSTLYQDSLTVSSTMTIKAIAYADSALPSSVSVGEYLIGPIPNVPPKADAGRDLIVEAGQVVTLNGSASFDPDGSPLEIVESWQQIDGPPAQLLDDDETVANFTPGWTGTYTFRLFIEDIEGARDSSDVEITAVNDLPDVLGDLLARWSCESGQGQKLCDTSPNAQNGEVQGAEWSDETNDTSDHSLFFDGTTSDRVEIGNLDVTGSAMSICFWTRINSYSTHDARFISKADGQNDSDHLWMVSTLNGDQLRFRLNTSNGGTATLISASGILPLDQWMHIAAVYDGSEMRLYRDGNLVASQAKSGVIGTNPSMDAAIGNQPASASGGARPFDGWLDEIRIYSRALSQTELDTIRNAIFQKCGLQVTSAADDGNGSFRRCIDCARTGDTVTFSNLTDTIYVASAPVKINNGLSISGNPSRLPKIFNGLSEPGVQIRSGIDVYMDLLDFGSISGTMLRNAGSLTLGSVHFYSGQALSGPAILNVGQAEVSGELLIKRE